MLVFMVREMFSFVADMQDHGHVHKMNEGQYQYDPSGHRSNGGKYTSPAIQRLPRSYHQRGIAQVKQVIARQQQFVDGIGEWLITIHEVQDIDPPVAVKRKADMNRDTVSDEQVKKIGDRIHTGDFRCIDRYRRTKIIVVSVFSIFTEN